MFMFLITFVIFKAIKGRYFYYIRFDELIKKSIY